MPLPRFKPCSLRELAEVLTIPLSPHENERIGALMIDRVAPLDKAEAGSLSVLKDTRYRGTAALTRASAVIVSPDDQHHIPAGIVALVHRYPGAAFARAVNYLLRLERAPQHKNDPVRLIHPSAHISPSAILGQGVDIREGVVIGCHVEIGEGSLVYPHVVIYEGVRIGKRAIIHAGVVIGSDGFGFAKEGESWVKTPQIGGVVIGDEVEIGANTTIDRGALEDTIIGNGVKIDNQVQIGHGVEIGEHTLIAGCVGIAGSTQIGKHCLIAGGAVIMDHLVLVDKVHIGPGTVVIRNISSAGRYTGIYPCQPHRNWLRSAAKYKTGD